MRRALRVVLIGSGVLFACGSDEQASSNAGSKSARSSVGGSSGGVPLSSAPKQGIATFYDADGSGNCSFDKSPDDLDVTAMAMPEYAASASCGGCLLVRGPKGEITVRVVDSCPGCEKNGVNLDLSAQAFAKIADPQEGRISISYQLVSCSTNGNVAYHFKDGSSQYWTAIQIRNHRIPIATVEYEKGGTWTELKRADYNYFVEDNGVGTGALHLRVSAIDGQKIEETLAQGVQDDTTVSGTQQFK